MRLLTITLVVAGLALAGCIAPDASQSKAAALAPPPTDRVEGMTMTETKTDKDVDCNGGNNGPVPLPATCAQRDLLATGRIGVTELPIDLAGSNGPITLTTSEGDAWSFHAVVKVKSAPNQDAKGSIDQAWAWSHENGGKHAIKAGPKSSSPVPIVGMEPSIIAARYELSLPSWVLISVTAKTGNGPITIAGKARDLSLETSNGPITLVVIPGESGSWSLKTSNGPIEVVVPLSDAHGYDVDATTSNGPVTIELGLGERTIEKGHGSFRSEHFDARSIQTKLVAETSNGPIRVAG